ncbi:hypothetical protein SAMN04488085_107115 [Geodermatophilus ruber]|uniref:Uncharacterized protein n=1 Tax=Geodermatophilus ruber TaxID=504800 RepID=A0A1I4FDX0_9ACTN|nr:hypothetical protein SAMN04488085_107115 [Geodermatophilus ruber]
MRRAGGMPDREGAEDTPDGALTSGSDTAPGVSRAVCRTNPSGNLAAVDTGRFRS